MAGPIPHRAAPCEEFLSWGSHLHCPMEVGAIIIDITLCPGKYWKSPGM